LQKREEQKNEDVGNTEEVGDGCDDGEKKMEKGVSACKGREGDQMGFS
jgi:hypothetical protein